MKHSEPTMLHTSPYTARWKIALAALFCAFGVTAVGSYFWMNHRADQDVLQLKKIVSSLAASDCAYSDLKVVRSTHPKAWIFGTVADSARKEAVRQKVAEVFSAEEARRIIGHIRLTVPGTRPSGI